MTLRQKVENNLAIWLLGLLVAGFLSGFAAYKTIIDVSGQITISGSDYERIKSAANRVVELEEEVETLKAKEGKRPSGHRMYLSENLVNDRPGKLLSKIMLDEKFYVSSKWVGLSGGGYYEQRWEVSDRDGIVAETWHPFVQKNTGQKYTWASFTLIKGENLPGNYRFRTYLNGERFTERELVVVEE